MKCEHCTIGFERDSGDMPTEVEIATLAASAKEKLVAHRQFYEDSGYTNGKKIEDLTVKEIVSFEISFFDFCPVCGTKIDWDT